MNWISIKDKLPDYGKKVMICLKKKNNACDTEYYYFVSTGYLCCTEGWNLEEYGEPVSWQYFPELPKDLT